MSEIDGRVNRIFEKTHRKIYSAGMGARGGEC